MNPRSAVVNALLLVHVRMTDAAGGPQHILRTSSNHQLAGRVPVFDVDPLSLLQLTQGTPNKLVRVQNTADPMNGCYRPFTSDKLFLRPMDKVIIIGVALCSGCSLIAATLAGVLILRHYRAGIELTGYFFVPHSRSVTYIHFIRGLPLFAATSLACVLFLELSPIWHFLEVLVLVSVLRLMPDLYAQSVGGVLQLQLRLNSPNYVQEAGAVHLHSQPPCICFRLFDAARRPTPADVAHLRTRVVILCNVLPLGTLIDLIFSFYAAYKPSATHTQEWVDVVMKIAEVLAITWGISGLKAMEKVVETINPRAGQELFLSAKLSYCRGYLFGLRLFPLLVGLIPARVFWQSPTLANGTSMLPSEQSESVQSVVTSVASVLIALSAWQAFPVDDKHYPELFAATQTGDSKFKTILSSVCYCPLCGSEGLEPDPHAMEMDKAVCPACNVRGIPMKLEVRTTNTDVTGRGDES